MRSLPGPAVLPPICARRRTRVGRLGRSDLLGGSCVLPAQGEGSSATRRQGPATRCERRRVVETRSVCVSRRTFSRLRADGFRPRSVGILGGPLPVSPYSNARFALWGERQAASVRRGRMGRFASWGIRSWGTSRHRSLRFRCSRSDGKVCTRASMPAPRSRADLRLR